MDGQLNGSAKKQRTRRGSEGISRLLSEVMAVIIVIAIAALVAVYGSSLTTAISNTPNIRIDKFQIVGSVAVIQVKNDGNLRIDSITAALKDDSGEPVTIPLSPGAIDPGSTTAGTASGRFTAGTTYQVTVKGATTNGAVIAVGSALANP